MAQRIATVQNFMAKSCHRGKYVEHFLHKTCRLRA